MAPSLALTLAPSLARTLTDWEMHSAGPSHHSPWLSCASSFSLAAIAAMTTASSAAHHQPRTEGGVSVSVEAPTVGFGGAQRPRIESQVGAALTAPCGVFCSINISSGKGPASAEGALTATSNVACALKPPSASRILIP